jgi:ATP-dependent Clp protease ATP-binding subunit ClpE
MFRPEFLNRIDEIIVFRELTFDQIRQIVELMLKELIGQLSEKKIALNVSDKAKDRLATEGYDVKYGARPLRKTIQKRLEDPMSDLYLTGKLEKASEIIVDYEGEKFTFDTVIREGD